MGQNGQNWCSPEQRNNGQFIALLRGWVPAVEQRFSNADRLFKNTGVQIGRLDFTMDVVVETMRRLVAPDIEPETWTAQFRAVATEASACIGMCMPLQRLYMPKAADREPSRIVPASALVH